MMSAKRMVFSLVALAACALFAQVPTVPASGGPVFPEFQLDNTAAAQALFVPMEGSLPVSLVPAGKQHWVRLPVNFVGTDHDRASWDVQVTTDLSVAQGIEFDFYSPDSSPVSSLAVYFRSGDGWYSARFGVERDGEWQRVLIDKSATGTEGEPAGWSQVDAIRICGWRGTAKDTFLSIANLRPVGADADILVVRADSCATAGDAESTGYSQFAGYVASCLRDAGLEHALLSDLDATPARLKGRKLVILPYNPRLPEGLLPILKDFVDQGGKVITLYSLPQGIPELIGFKRGVVDVPEGGRYQGFARVGDGLEGQPEFAGQASWRSHSAEPIPGTSRTVAVWRSADGKDTSVPAIVVSDRGAHVGHVWLKDDWANKKTLLLSLVAGTVPGVWQRAAEKEFAKIGVFGKFRSFKETLAALKKTQIKEAALAVYNGTVRREQGGAHLARKRWRESIAMSQLAAKDMLRAWCLSQPSQKGEFRAFWCHSAFGITGKSWDEAIKQLADSGFNAILPNMLWGGTAFYPSKVLPEYRELATKGDQIAQCLTACRKYGVECHVWKVNWNTGGRADKDFLAKMAAAKRVQVSDTGEVKDEWLCPSHPENQALEVAAMVELAKNYAVDGIHFDYIRYPSNRFCFCDGCRVRFEQRIGRKVANWPADIKDDKALKQQWLDFRRSNIDTVVRQVSEQARKVRPGIKISAAVFRNWPVDRDGVGQDWKLWCDKGWLDFVCPMDYTESNATFRNQVKAQVGYAGKVPVYPGIGLSVWRDPQDVVKLIEQIEISRKYKTGGFTIFEYNSRMAGVLPLVSLGTTSTK
ncbi:MAG: family 10 glycosylhydrolase [Victivallales bacterium]|nr:family 10 glycosylhydrolase [Victivallales bacterium]